MKNLFSIFVVLAFLSLNAFGQVEIDNAKNVGIGIATPTHKLDVNGELRIRTIPIDNALTEILVKDNDGVVHTRDFSTLTNWTRIADTLYSDTLSSVFINGKTRTIIGNALFDICPIPGGIGGGINLIFNKDNICIGKFGWVEKSLPLPFPPLTPDPVFKLFPRTGGAPTSAPGFELATFGELGLGLDGIRLMLCPSDIGPFPLWDNPRIDLLIDNEILINPGGLSGGMGVRNIGSSGQDGVGIEFPGTGRLTAANDSTMRSTSVEVKPPDTSQFSVDSFFDIYFDIEPLSRMTMLRLDTGGVSGTGMLLQDAHLIQGASGGGGAGGSIWLHPDVSLQDGGSILKVSNLGSSGCDGVSIDLGEDARIEGRDDLAVQGGGGGGGRIAIKPNGTSGSDYLAVSNLGSSGLDGVRIALSEADPLTPLVDIELVALSLESTGPIEVVSLDNNDLQWAWSFESTDQRLSRTISAPGTPTATPHVYEYDANNNVVRETGPDSLIYESDLLRTTYTYDGLDRMVREVRSHTGAPGQTTAIEHEFPVGSPPQLRLLAGNIQLQAPITTVQGDLYVQGNLFKLGGTFKIDHPQDPYNKYLSHSFVESPDMMNIYNGNIKTDENGYATVSMPDYFSALNMDFRYQLTAMGTFAQAIIKEKLADNKFVIQTDKPNVEVSWQVTGIRNDTYAKENRVQVEVDKEEALKGKLLYEPKKDLGLINQK